MPAEPMQSFVDGLHALVTSWSGGTGRFIVGLAGAVGVGKTTMASRIASHITSAGRSCSVISTDGFLYPNAVLEPRGILLRKGYPESYDEGALRGLVDAVRGGATELDVPTYAHERFDTGVPERRSIGDIVLFEGINALQRPLVDLVDERIYLDVEEPIVRAWFVERMLRLIVAAETDDTSFYAQFRTLDLAGRRSFAVSVWEQINLPNLVEHIAPSRHRADVMIRLNAEHDVAEVLRL